jgi:hypothetical protein
MKYMRNKILEESLLTENNFKLMKEKSISSFNVSKLLGVPLKHSQSVIFGTVFQNFVRNLIEKCDGIIMELKYADIYNVGDTSLNEGKKDVDLFFKFDNKMYYFEQKVNLDLDSEKSKATNKKVEDIAKWIKTNYPNIELHYGVLTVWYEKELGLPVKIENPFFMSDLFNILKLNIPKEEYYETFNSFGMNI